MTALISRIGIALETAQPVGAAKKFERAMDGVAGATRDVNGRLRDVNGKFIGAGKAAAAAGAGAKAAVPGVRALGLAFKAALGPLLGVTAAIGAATAALRTIAGQDFALAKVRSLGVDSDVLAAALKNVSAELEGNASVAELTAAAYDVASAGFTNAADAALVLKAASLGAVGGFSDINTVGDAATSVLNAYGKSANDAALLVDGFIQTQNDGKIVVDQYAQNIGKVASAAAGLKIPITEINAVIAQSTASGNQAEVAFTGLKGALARLASGEATKALKGVGLNINAASLEADGLLGTFKKIEAAGLDTGQLFKAFGTEAGPALLPVLQNLERFEELLENQKNAAGAARKAQQEAANTIGGAWGRVGVAIQNLFSDQAALAQAIIPILDATANAINGITEATEGFKAVAEAVNGTVTNLGKQLGVVGDAFGGLGNAIKFAADQLGRLILRADGFDDPVFKEIKRIQTYDASQGAGFDIERIRQMQSGAVNPPKKITETNVPDFSPDLSGNAAGEAEKLLNTQLKSGAELSKQFERQIKLKEASTDLLRQELQVEFERQDALANIAETAELGQQADLNALANKIALLDTEEARAENAEKLAKIQAKADKDAADAAQRRLEADPGYQMQQQLEKLLDTQNQAAFAAQSMGNAFANAFGAVVTGAKSGQEALAGMLKSIAADFLGMAKKIIAQQLTMILYGTIMKALGIGGGFNSAAASPGGSAGVAGIGGGGLGDVFGNTSSFGTFAEGGYVNKPTNALIGEGGEPEYVIPESKMRESMSRYSRGSRGGGVIPSDGGSSASGDGGTAVAAAIDVRYTVERINSVDYVTADQFQSGMRNAAAQGAQRGEQNTLKRLQMSGSTRKRVGI